MGQMGDSCGIYGHREKILALAIDSQRLLMECEEILYPLRYPGQLCIACEDFEAVLDGKPFRRHLPRRC